MKKIIALLVAMIMLFTMAIAEDATTPELTEENFYGAWYATQLITDGVAYSYAEFGTKVRLDLNKDGTGSLWQSEEDALDINWRVDEDGTIRFADPINQVDTFEIKMQEDGTLVLGETEDISITFARSMEEPVDYAKPIEAENITDFDGQYALTAVSGEGYSVAAEKADELLAPLGVTSTAINIASGMVEFLGREAKQAAFTEGRLFIDGGNKDIPAFNITITKLEDKGIAADWLGLTLYAYPAIEEYGEAQEEADETIEPDAEKNIEPEA